MDIKMLGFGVLFLSELIALRDSDWKRHAPCMLSMFKHVEVMPYLDMIVSCINRFVGRHVMLWSGQIHIDSVKQRRMLSIK